MGFNFLDQFISYNDFRKYGSSAIQKQCMKTGQTCECPDAGRTVHYIYLVGHQL